MVMILLMALLYISPLSLSIRVTWMQEVARRVGLCLEVGMVVNRKAQLHLK